MHERDRIIEKKIQTDMMLGFYESLLTSHQQNIIDLYHYEDLSLSEIADQLNISRQGVHDAILRAIKQLHYYENKLGLYKRHLALEKSIREVLELTEKISVSSDSQILLDTIAEKLLDILKQGEI